MKKKVVRLTRTKNSFICELIEKEVGEKKNEKRRK